MYERRSHLLYGIFNNSFFVIIVIFLLLISCRGNRKLLSFFISLFDIVASLRIFFISGNFFRSWIAWVCSSSVSPPPFNFSNMRDVAMRASTALGTCAIAISCVEGWNLLARFPLLLLLELAKALWWIQQCRGVLAARVRSRLLPDEGLVEVVSFKASFQDFDFLFES